MKFFNLIALVSTLFIISSCGNSERDERKKLSERLEKEQNDLKNNKKVMELKDLFSNIYEEINESELLVFNSLDSNNKIKIGFNSTDENYSLFLNEEFLRGDSLPEYLLSNDNQYRRALSIMNNTYFASYAGFKEDEKDWKNVKDLLENGTSAKYIFLYKTINSRSASAYGDFLAGGSVDGALIVYDNEKKGIANIFPVSGKNSESITYTESSGDYNAGDRAAKNDLKGNIGKEMNRIFNTYFNSKQAIPYFKLS